MLKNKKLWLVILAIILCLLFLYYINYDGINRFKKMYMSEKELVNEFGEINFGEEAIIENFSLASEASEPNFFSHTECIRATILLPKDSVDKLFEGKIRNYNPNYTFSLTEEQRENFMFFVREYRTVVKLGYKTQRTINFIITEHNDKYVRIYAFVDKLGWNLY